ncbi:MAG: sterol desaturase family protein [Thalassobaculaceae bacterium]
MLDWRPSTINPITSITINIIVLDFPIYGWHRANHKLLLLWRFHKIHHLNEFLDITTALRFHFGEILLSTFFRAVIIIIFDISWVSIICFEIFVLFAPVFQHSNIRIPELPNKIISKFSAVPSVHGIHHHAIDRDTNSNYSTIFSVWDKIFTTGRSLRLTAVGIISIAGKKDQPLLQLLIRPFSSKL